MKPTGGKDAQSGVSCHDPEAVVFPPESVETGALRQVPNSDAFVLRVGQDELLARVEKDARHVVVVAAAGIHFPSLQSRSTDWVYVDFISRARGNTYLGFAHTPQLDLTVVRSRDNERQSGMEWRPVNSPVVAFQNVADDGISLTEQVRWAGIAQMFLQPARSRRHILLPQTWKWIFLLRSLIAKGLRGKRHITRNVPDSHSLIQWGRNNQILTLVELGTHNIMVMASENRDTGSALPVPNAYGLVVWGTEDPWVFMVEDSGTNVVHVPRKSELAATKLIIPYLSQRIIIKLSCITDNWKVMSYFDLVIISTRNEKWLLAVKANASNRAIMLIKLIQQSAHAVVP